MRWPRIAATLLLTLLAALAGCTDRRITEETDDAAKPIRGGTLRLVGSSDVDHLSTTSGYLTGSLWLFRGFTRQLVSNPPSDDFDKSITLEADAAIEVPSVENGGISADALTYTFHLKPKLRWNSTPVRRVVAGDFVRAFKLFCNPVNPVGAPPYYTSTIEGLDEYCSAMLKVPGTVEGIRRFVENNEIPGVRAVDDGTLEIRLRAPAADFIYLVAMPFASAVPVEYLDYLPDSPEFRQHTLSNGPYAITRYLQNREIVLERNPAWDAASDPIRPAWVDRIQIKLGIDPALIQLQIEAGTADLGFDSSMLTVDQSSLQAIGDPRVSSFPPGEHYSGMRYLAVNQVGPNNGGALSQLKVRQALALAVDKSALVQVSGGPDVASPLNQAVMNGVSGWRPGADQYSTPDDRGDPVAARRLLTEAGFPDGIPLRFAYPVEASYAIQAQATQASLTRAGFEVTLFPFAVSDFFGRLLPNPQNAKRGEWDIALGGWLPDWVGGNNGRSVLSPLFDGRQLGNLSQNYGKYDNPITNAAIDRALSAATQEQAEAGWADATRQVTADVGIVPMLQVKSTYMRSSRLRHCVWSIMGMQCDLASVWLADAVDESSNKGDR
ncbi:MAG: ABC transporter substrate-binding protein [Woeseiaceae bacterium]|nr:ABC transporter substrate-binding protein [Woeseiaceae bacterium]